MAGPANDLNRDIPWLGAWIPLCFGLVGVGALLYLVNVPTWVLVVFGPLVVIGVFLFLWGPNGRLGQLGRKDDGPERS